MNWVLFAATGVLAIILVLMAFSGILPGSNQMEPAPAACVMQSGFKCSDFYLDSNGLLSVSLEPAISYPIDITAVGCNHNVTSLHSQTIRPEANVQPDAGVNLSIMCYEGLEQFNGSIGEPFAGYLAINYTDSKTGFPEVIYGTIQLKVSN